MIGQEFIVIICLLLWVNNEEYYDWSIIHCHYLWLKLLFVLVVVVVEGSDHGQGWRRSGCRLGWRTLGSGG